MAIRGVELYVRNEDGELEPVVISNGSSSTIHNYFPDGAVTNGALIDTGAQDYDTHLWQGQGGSEVLSFAAAVGGKPNAVKLILPGDGFAEGVEVGDFANHYGGGLVPAGLIRVGATLWADAPDPYYLYMQIGLGIDFPGEYNETIYRYIGPDPTRVVLTGWLQQPGPVSFKAYTTNLFAPTEIPAQDATLYVAHLMITEGEAFQFADGDSDGWSWDGAANASVSSGPQP